MKRNIFILCSFIVFAVFTSYAQSLTEQAAAAYNKDDFNQALELYLEASQQEGTSSELFYNIGNTYYKLDKKGKAILYYERALLLDPNNSNARDNLDYVRSDKGRTSGSRVIFTNKNKASILLHKPHPRKELLAYQIKQLIKVLSQEGLL